MFGAFLDAAMSIPNNMMMEEDRNQRQADQWGHTIADQNFNSAQAVEQRAWSERLSNTQYQRAADDASKAGLNRILAMRQGGAGVPSGSSAASNSSGGSGGSPGQAQSNFAAAQVMEDQKDNIQADTTLKGTQRSYTSQLWNTSRAEEALLNERTNTQREATRRERADADIATADAKGRTLEGNIDDTTWGNILRWINRTSQSIQGASSAARRASPQ